ncbi:response regulator [Acutalibacter muris]|nr:response regulator [Acutalibacter muris]QQR29867.1 response regulator [Acutalibacter muris]
MLDLLLVDDEKDVLEAMAGTIKWENYGVRLTGTCENAIEALRFMEVSPPDIVITDVKMPVMDGIEMIKQAKEMGIKAEFVILSGFSEFEFAQRAMSFGIRYYLLKPCGEKELGEVLERVQKDCAKRPRAAFPAPDPEASAPQKSQHFVDEIIEYVNQNLSDSRLSLKWIANNLVFRNEDYVGKAFAAHTGENFLTYLNRRRIQRAKELLEPGKDNKIYAVAEEIGLGHNPRYFSKLFKKYVGCSPREYQAGKRLQK